MNVNVPMLRGHWSEFARLNRRLVHSLLGAWIKLFQGEQQRLVSPAGGEKSLYLFFSRLYLSKKGEGVCAEVDFLRQCRTSHVISCD